MMVALTVAEGVAGRPQSPCRSPNMTTREEASKAVTGFQLAWCARDGSLELTYTILQISCKEKTDWGCVFKGS